MVRVGPGFSESQGKAESLFLSITLSGKFIGIVMLGWIVVGTLRAVLRLPLPMMRLALGWAIREGSFGRCAPVFCLRREPHGAHTLGRSAAGDRRSGGVGPLCARKLGGGVCDNIAWFRK